jgi:HSP20 family protein
MARSLTPFSLPGALRTADPALQLHRDMSRLVEDVVRGFGMPTLTGTRAIMTPPRLDVSETENELRIRAELAGVVPDEIEIDLDGDMLTIRGEKRVEQEDDEERYHVVERAYGAFARSIQLPFAPNPEDVQASFDNGVLTITLPKGSAQQTSRRIQVQSGAPSRSGNGQGSGVDRAAAGDKPGMSGASAEGGGATATEQAAAGGTAQEGSAAGTEAPAGSSGQAGKRSAT